MDQAFVGVGQRIGKGEHLGHVRIGGYVPVADILIEGRGLVEHEGHVSDGGHVPIPDGLVE